MPNDKDLIEEGSIRKVTLTFIYENNDPEVTNYDAKRLAVDMLWERLCEVTDPSELQDNIEVSILGPIQHIALDDDWRDILRPTGGIEHDDADMRLP